ncbi:hypothetical protein HPP92_007791 [Vanilla planifolia]|uniref:Altered inheritance of mitochondria protein 24, mitochondrial n=1 Tax=Vanilla planifolia TaxID=51239 RepID=A0A835VB08_VANPL|nr:hypothetical protein HPP92_007791 [Vanilla planifolia]
MAAPFFSVPFQPYVYQIMLKSQDKVTSKPVAFGKNIISIVFSNTGPDDGYVGISAPSPARIIPIDLANFGGEMLCQADAFLCSLNDVKVSNVADQRARNITSGSEVVLKQKLVGQGLAFFVGGGSVVQKILDVGEVVVVDAACIVAMTSTINFK